MRDLLFLLLLCAGPCAWAQIGLSEPIPSTPKSLPIGQEALVESGKLLRASAHLQIASMVFVAGGATVIALLQPVDPADMSIAWVGGGLLCAVGVGFSIGSIADKAKAGKLLQRSALKQ